MIRRLTFLALLSSPLARAFDAVTFVTAQDHFTVKKNAHQFTIDGQNVHSELLRLLDPLLTGEAMDDCPSLKGKPLVKAIVTAGAKTETREFFVEQEIVRIGDKCLSATGDGLNFLPMHRSWLIGPFRESIQLKSPLRITGPDGNPIAELVIKDGEWQDTKPQTDLDFEFFDKWQQSLKDYRVQYRVLPTAAKGKPSVTVTSGGQKLVFYKLAPKLWAVQRGSQKWLDASGEWAFWYELDESVWHDRRANAIHQIEAAGVPVEQKQALMKQLDDNGWSRALEDFYQRRLQDNNEDLEVRLHALERLKNKPSWRNIRAEMQALENNPNDDLLKQLTIVLRIRNPKGIIYEPKSTDRAETVEGWSAWWKKNSNRKD